MLTPSSSLFLLAYFKLDILKSIARTLELLYRVAACNASRPVPQPATKIFGLFRSEAGEELVLEKNFFVERILLADSSTGYTEEEKSEYIRPFINPGEDRRPTLTWPRQIPLDGEPSEVVEEVRLNAEFHKESDIPKLFINADPGSILIGDQREFVRSWNLSLIHI